MIRGSAQLARIARGLNWGAISAVAVMMLLSTADVVLRLFNRPIPGAYELIGFLGTVVVSFALAFTSLEKGHISVELLVIRLPFRLQLFIEGFHQLLGTFLLGLIASQAFFYALDIKKSGEVSLTLQWPLYPFIFGIAVGCGLLALILLAEAVNSWRRTFKS
ncbi:MAG: TRAP transporter small permease [Thermodesulfobacteriota bacterium]